MGDIRFERCILLAENSPPTLWIDQDCPESAVDQTPLALAGHTLGYII